MKIRKFRSILSRYLNHSATNAEKFIVDSWYRSFDKNQDKTVPGIENSIEESQTRQRILNGLMPLQHPKIWYRNPLLGVACGLLLLSGIAFLFLSKPKPHQLEQPIVFQTLRGQTKKIILSDSTVVLLNANSKLELAANYADTTRSVKLIGEAYFEVKSNPKKPFLVETKNLTTKVLGTSFNVRSYLSSRYSKITLLTGRVWIGIKEANEKTPTEVILNPNEILRYDHQLHQSSTTNEQSSVDQKAWTLGRLIFNNTPMDEVREILYESHGLEIQLSSGKLDNARIYGEFRTNDKPDYIISTICKLINAKYTVNGKKVLIQSMP
ncbi:MAG: DUF4974 domain-containing protein [Pedobacter sp.]|nr:MAG: DUF4974 domain-containing protein [Pedobacter sp.]